MRRVNVIFKLATAAFIGFLGAAVAGVLVPESLLAQILGFLIPYSIFLLIVR